MKYVDDQNTKMPKASESKDQHAPTPYKNHVTHSSAKEGFYEIITDVIPIRVVYGRVSTKRKTKHLLGKRLTLQW